MTLEEIKDLVKFCRENGVTQLKVGEMAMVIEPIVHEIQQEPRAAHPFDQY